MKYLLISLGSLFTGLLLQGQTFEIDPEQSQLKWEGSAAFSAYKLSGHINAKEGFITIQNNQITQSKLVIDMKTISSEINQLTKHLKSKDFFEVKSYPTATFQWAGELPSNTSLKLAGSLNIKEQAQNHTIEGTLTNLGATIVFKGSTIIDRTQFGVNFNSPNFFKHLKDQAIADDFVLEYQLVFKKMN